MNHRMNAPNLPSQPTSRAGTVWLSTLLFGALSFSVGCASYNARKQLEGVAKNWCETIRASQVIPVYPLTEDLTPGDVFLVQRPIATEAKAYSAGAFSRSTTDERG